MKKQLKREGRWYIVNPYALVWQNERYYLVGNYDKYDDLSLYRLDRIKNLSSTEEIRKDAKEILGPNADLQIDELIQTSLYHYDGEKILLELEVYEKLVDDLVDYFGSNLQFYKSGNKYTVAVNVRENAGLYYWLLQYENNIKVLAPEKVKRQLVEKVKGILSLYEEG